MLQKILVLMLLLNASVFTQEHTGLRIMPHQIHFMNNFERQRTVTVTNNGQNTINVDSISYDESILHLILNESNSFPISLNQNDSFSFEVILYNYFDILEDDSSKIISIYNSGTNPVEEIQVEIKSFMQHRMKGTISGTVADSSQLISDAKLYFFYQGTLLVDSAITDVNGQYSKEIPAGNYFVAVQKENYYMQFSILKDSPIEADYISVHKNDSISLDFMLEEETPSDLAISGVIVDDKNGAELKKAIVIIRKGKHTPRLLKTSLESDEDRSYTVLTNSEGEYKIANILNEGGYYLQAFSQFHLPGYFNHMNEPVSMWQNADSVVIRGNEIGKNIYMHRDSAYGAGLAGGHLDYNNQTISVSDALIYAISVESNKVYSYSFSNSDGNFGVGNLPYGSYNLVSQKIGFDDAYSEEFTISTEADTVQNLSLSIISTGVAKDFATPNDFQLYQNYPNPFNPTTIIRFYVPEHSFVQLNIYNSIGESVGELQNNNLPMGSYEIIWDAKGLAAGVYFLKLIAHSPGNNNTFTGVKKLLLIK